MINNRVYETLGCGRVLISDSFDMIEREFGDLVYFDRKPGDTGRIVTRLLETEEGKRELKERGARGRKRVIERESWSHRVIEMLALRERLSMETRPRPLRPIALIVGDGRERERERANRWGLASLIGLEKEYRLERVLHLDQVDDKMLLEKVDVVVVLGEEAREMMRKRIKLIRRRRREEKKKEEKKTKKKTKDEGEAAVMENKKDSKIELRDSHGMLARKVLVLEEGQEDQQGEGDDLEYDVVIIHVSSEKETKEEETKTLTSMLQSGMDRAIDLPRMSSRIALDPPSSYYQHGNTFIPGEVVRFHVRMVDFVAPDHGMWCVRVNGEETSCVGDAQNFVDLVVPVDSGSYMTVQPLLRTHVDRHLFKEGRLSQYMLRSVVEEMVIDGTSSEIRVVDGRSLYQDTRSFCQQKILSDQDCRRLLNHLLTKAPAAAAWRDRTDRKIQVGVVVDAVDWNARKEFDVKDRINIAMRLDIDLYQVFFFVLVNDDADENEDEKSLIAASSSRSTPMDTFHHHLEQSLIGIVNIMFPRDLSAAMVDPSDLEKISQQHHPKLLPSLIDVLRGLDVLEFLSSTKSRTFRERILSFAASSLGIPMSSVAEKRVDGLIEGTMEGGIPMSEELTNLAMDFESGMLKIPPMVDQKFADRDRSAVQYFRRAQTLSLLPEEIFRFGLSLPLFERRLRFHRGVPVNEWLSPVEWHDYHNDAVSAVLQLRLQRSVPKIVAAAIEEWNDALVDPTTGNKKLDYPTMTGFWPGMYRSRGNFFITARHKILHDAAQLRYLVNAGRLPSYLMKVAENYTKVHDIFLADKPMNHYVFMNQSYYDMIGTTYNWLTYKHPLPVVPSGALYRDVLSKDHFQAAEKEYFSAERAPGLTVIDNFLSKEALSSLLEFLRSSTIWYDVKPGYLGTYHRTGLTGPLLIQIERELRERMPNIIGSLPLRTVWAYKCFESSPEGLAVHADTATVNLNLWLTPDEANIDDGGSSGGLAVHLTKTLPENWNFKKLNQIASVKDIYKFLKETNSERVQIPYKQNRAVVFHSRLFHESVKFHFKKGFKNARINLTFLFGNG